VVTKGGLVFIGGGDTAFHALDKATGKDLWSAPTKETTGTPMTYQTRAGRQFVLVCTGRSTQATLVAFALPSGSPATGPKVDRSGRH
jgi:glucose dehydrogenase